jgi:copper chaperone
MTYSYKVTMTCGGCTGAITRILTKQQNDQKVKSFDVSLEKQLVTVESDVLSKEEVFEIIKKSGKATEML